VNEFLEVSWDDVTAQVLVRRSSRARRVTLRMTDSGFVITMPQRTPLMIAKGLLSDNQHWIRQHFEKWEAKKSSLPIDQILIHGEPYQVLLTDRRPAMPLNQEAKTVTIPVQDHTLARKVLRQILRRYAAEIIPVWVARESARTGLMPNKVIVRDQKTKWGSCSTNRTLSLNWRIVMAPQNVADYLIVHELAHLIHMNHSKEFWALVERHCPDYRRLDRWLTTEGWRLMMSFSREP
jgi:hypothetical protein